MKGGFLLDVVVRKGSSILELLSSEDKSLLIGWDTFLVLNLGLDVLNGVSWLDIEGDGLSSEGFNEDLHTTSESEDEMEGGFLLDVVVGEGSAVFELLAREDQTLLVGRDALLVLDLGLDILNGVRGLDVEGNGLAGESLDENLHRECFVLIIIIMLEARLKIMSCAIKNSPELSQIDLSPG